MNSDPNDPDPEGAFLIPYAIALATLGLPLFILELAVSHSDPYFRSDPDPDPYTDPNSHSDPNPDPDHDPYYKPDT